jgi:hypothetical protein
MSLAGFWLPAFGHQVTATPLLVPLSVCLPDLMLRHALPRFGWSCSCGAGSGPGEWWSEAESAEKAGAEHIPSAGVAA